MLSAVAHLQATGPCKQVRRARREVRLGASVDTERKMQCAAEQQLHTCMERALLADNSRTCPFNIPAGCAWHAFLHLLAAMVRSATAWAQMSGFCSCKVRIALCRTLNKHCVELKALC